MPIVENKKNTQVNGPHANRKENSMITSVSSSNVQLFKSDDQTKPVEPKQPQAPTPPPGGNIESRQPPQKPSEPAKPSDSALSIYA